MYKSKSFLVHGLAAVVRAAVAVIRRTVIRIRVGLLLCFGLFLLRLYSRLCFLLRLSLLTLRLLFGRLGLLRVIAVAVRARVRTVIRRGIIRFVRLRLLLRRNLFLLRGPC